MSAMTTDNEPPARPRHIERPVEFWTGQLTVTVGTVLGVYLPAISSRRFELKARLATADVMVD